jgi:hypothetical protein
MSRRHLRLTILLLATAAAIVAAIVLLFAYGVRDAAAFIVITAMLVLAYLVRRRARAQVLYTDDAARRPPRSADREMQAGVDWARSNGRADGATVSQRDRNV